MTETGTTLLQAALRYADLGYPVFPCLPGGKAPATAHGFLDATTDAGQIEAPVLHADVFQPLRRAVR